MGKGKNAIDQHFLPFPILFSTHVKANSDKAIFELTSATAFYLFISPFPTVFFKTFFCRVVKSRDCVVKS